MRLYLICRDARLFHQPVPLSRGAKYTVGRALECELFVKDSSVSRQHAEVLADGSQLRIRDLQSLNGTFLDGAKVEECAVGVGQVIRFGRIDFLLTDDPNRQPWPRTQEGDESTAPIEAIDQRRTAILQTLTESQRRVTALLLEGLSEKEAAARLRLSPHTVHNHIKEVYRRLEVNSRAEMLALFVS